MKKRKSSRFELFPGCGFLGLYAELKSETQQLTSHDKLLVGLMEDNYQMKQDNKVIKETLDSLVRYLESGK